MIDLWQTYTSERFDASTEILELTKVQNKILEFDYDSAKTIIKNFTPKKKVDSIGSKLMWIKIKMKEQSGSREILSIIESLESHAKELSSFLPLEEELLFLRATYHLQINETQLALTYIHKALKILESKDKSKFNNLVKSRLLGTKADILFDEGELYNETVIYCYTTALDLVSNTEYPNTYGKHKLNYFHYLSKKGGDYIEKNKGMLEEFLSSEFPKSPEFDQYLQLNLGLIDSINGSNKFLKSLGYTVKKPCHKMNLIILSNIVNFHIANNQDSSKYYLDKLEQFNDCSNNLKKWKDFYKYESLFILGNTYGFPNIDIAIFNNTKRRLLAEELFQNEELHLGDFYSQNTSEICQIILSKNSTVPEHHIAKFRQLFNDAKFKIERLNNYKGRDPRDAILNNLLKEINDFKDTTNYDSPAYDQLYDLLSNKPEEEIKTLPKTQELSSQNVIHYLKFKEMYYCYSYQNSRMKLHSFPDSIATNFLNYQNSCNQSLFSYDLDSISYYASQILPKEVDLDKDFVIITDGHLENISFDLLLSTDEVSATFSHSPYDRLYDENISVVAENSAIFSFSDNETINDLRPKQFLELPYGYQECQSLAKLFDGEMYEGEKFTQESFIKNINKDLIHVSTHSVHNKENRFENYLMARNKDKLDSIFISDLSGMECKAKFISIASCENNLGQHLDGNGTYSISKTFLNAGSETILKTLWKVDDRATKEFMVKFYESWLTGISVLDAQHEAKIYMRDSTEFTHPYYWAGFALEGNPNLYLSEN